MARLKAVEFEDRLTLVEHLDELRVRILVSGVALVAVAVACFLQRGRLLDVANAPLPDTAGGDPFTPITFGPTEPLFTTLTVVGYAALIITSPLILYQAYAFLAPALSREELSKVRPMILLVPGLFIAGVAFAYFAILPLAMEFLLAFGQDTFQVELRARDYYAFLGFLLFAMGVVFQMPIGILAFVRIGVVSPDQLRRNRPLAFFVIAVLAMLVTPPDPVTMVITIVPLWALYEISMLLARTLGRPAGDATPSADGVATEPPSRPTD